MASGDLLLELKDLEQYDKLSHLVAFGNIPVSRTSFAEVVQRGAAPQRPLAVARTTRSVPRLTPLAPTVGAASAALPTPNQSTPVASAGSGSSRGNEEAKGVPSTSGLVGAKASSTVAKPTLSKHRSVERLSVAPPEAMDITGPPAQAAPKEREPLAVAPAPVVAVAKAAPPTQLQSPATPGSSGLKTTPREARSEARTVSLRARASSASREAMDTTPAPLAPKDRRSSIERAPKGKQKIQCPEKDS
ncbi:neurofilament heavy polypeptide-like [Rhipicephalus sanguineus]|uniref:neurofilament heavy polypeptide-like n=1 Tax=Rhipicephalus sanguineus TaxID=34632 RepID=UPI0020C4EF18|nr:neurofilament heavy polypeptide-like [Rhipicephalus sanguineus]